MEKSEISVEFFPSEHRPSRLAANLAGASWVVDALLGTGARGEPRPPIDAVIDQLNAAATPKLAVDLPSGLDCDTGIPARHTIRAKETCTFVAAKPGFYAARADEFTGRLHILDIGAPRKLVAEILGKS
jgi:NAD(P)H-hydrate epimerase